MDVFIFLNAVRVQGKDLPFVHVTMPWKTKILELVEFQEATE
jgi:hypothetical protein